MPSVFENIFGEGGVFDQVFGSSTPKKLAPADSPLKSYTSATDDKEMVLTVDLPGVDPKSVSLKVGDDQVVIRGKRGKKGFSQRYTISRDYDTMSAQASLQHGQLTIRLARAKCELMKAVDIDVR